MRATGGVAQHLGEVDCETDENGVGDLRVEAPREDLSHAVERVRHSPGDHREPPERPPETQGDENDADRIQDVESNVARLWRAEQPSATVGTRVLAKGPVRIPKCRRSPTPDVRSALED